MEERFDEIWNKFVKIYPQLKSFERPRVVFNGRLRKTAGRAIYMDNKVELSKKLYEENTEAFWADTIPHEFAHIVTHLIWGCENVTHHGKEWKSVMKAYGIEPKIYHDFVC
jgi:SprT protein